jgi:hypothetical protein
VVGLEHKLNEEALGLLVPPSKQSHKQTIACLPHLFDLGAMAEALQCGGLLVEMEAVVYLL